MCRQYRCREAGAAKAGAASGATVGAATGATVGAVVGVDAVVTIEGGVDTPRW